MCLLVSRLQSHSSGHDLVPADAWAVHGPAMARAGLPLPSSLVGPTGNDCPMCLELSEFRPHPFEIALGHRNHGIPHTLCASNATLRTGDPTQSLVCATQAVYPAKPNPQRQTGLF